LEKINDLPSIDEIKKDESGLPLLCAKPALTRQTTQSDATVIERKPAYRSGYEDVPRFGGPGSAGAMMEASVSGGIGYNLKESIDLIGFSLNWGRPPDSGMDDQYTAEVFYWLQLAQNLAITPDVQLIFNPALNPDEDMLRVFGLRARLAL
jgi:porin